MEDEEEETLFYDLVLSQTVHTLRLAISKDSKGKLGGESPLWSTTLQQQVTNLCKSGMLKRSPGLIICQTEMKLAQRNFLPRKGMYFLRISNVWEISMVNVDRSVCTLDPTTSTFSHSRAGMMTHPLRGGTISDSHVGCAIPNQSHPHTNLKNLGWIKKVETGF